MASSPPSRDAVRSAGALALGFFRPGEKTSAAISHKDGGSPVTEADHLVDRFLKQRLEALLPEAGWLSEETEDSAARLTKKLILVVDPIDGTRAFARGDSTWAVAVALVQEGRPLIGIVHARLWAKLISRSKTAARASTAIRSRFRGSLRSTRTRRWRAPASLAQDLRQAD